MVSNTVLKMAADSFQFDMQTASFISNSCNEVYKFTKDNQSYILRLTEKPIEYADKIKAEVDWVYYLALNNVNVSLPVHTVSHQLNDVYLVEDKCYIATAFHMAPGRIVNTSDPELWGPGIFSKWGETMGRMHHVTKSYEVNDSETKRDEWGTWDIDSLHLRQGDFELVYSKLKALESTISSYPKDKESYGLIHNDLHPFNFHIDRGQITVFDFDDAMYGWFALDIAIAAAHATWIGAPSDDRERKNEFAKQFVHDFLEGYTKHHVLDDYWLKQIPIFMDFRNTSSFFWWLSSWNGDESRLTKAQVDAIANAVRVSKNNIPFDGCDFQI